MNDQEVNLLDETAMMLAARENVQRILKMLDSYDSFDVLAALRFVENAIDPEDYSESSHNGLGAAVEFVASIAAMKNYEPRTPVRFQTADIRTLHELSHSSLMIAQMLKLSKSKLHEGESQGLSWIAANMAVNSIIVRGHAYPHHLKSLLLELAAAVDEVVQEAVGLRLSEAIAIDDAIFELERQLGQQVLADLSDLSEVLHGYAQGNFSRADAVAKLGSAPPLLDELRKADWENVLDQFCEHFMLFNMGTMCRIAPQDVSTHTGLSDEKFKAFIRQFSVEFGEIEGDVVLPSATSPFLKRPFIASGQKFLRINNDVYSYTLPRIEQLINPNAGAGAIGTQRQWERYHQKRDKFLEHKTTELFKKLMPIATVESSLSYPIPGDKSGASAELDCLVVHDNNFIFVEAKATAVSDSTRRGSTLKIQADSRKGLGKGAQQAARAAEHVMSADGKVTFTRDNGSELEITLPPIRNCFHIVVTLDHMDALFVNSTQLASVGLTPELDGFWAVGIRDLIVFADLIEFPTQLLHYIERRNFTLSKHRVIVGDELDLLCCYLSQGLYFERVSESEPLNIHLASHTQQLDDYYNFERGFRETPATKPRLDLPEDLRKLIVGMESSNLAAGSEATKVLLSMSGKTREEFERGIRSAAERCRKTRTNRSIAMAISDYGITYFVFPP